MGTAVVLVLLVVVAPAVDAARRRWDDGVEVTFRVVETDPDGSYVIGEVGGDRTWTTDEIGDADPGALMLGRLVDDCRCRLMLLEPPRVRRLEILSIVAVVVAVVGRSHLRWRTWRNGLVAASSPGEPVTIRPTWMRRSAGRARWAVMATREDGSDVLVELDLSPVTWLDRQHQHQHRLHLHPSGRPGAAIVSSGGELVVASAAPMPGERGARRIVPWANDLNVAIGLEEAEPARQPQVQTVIGGNQRVRFGPRQGQQRLRPGSWIHVVPMALVAVEAVVLWRFWGVVDLLLLAGLYIVTRAAVMGVAAARLSRRPPLDRWPRSDARQAARSVVWVPSVSAVRPMPAR